MRAGHVGREKAFEPFRKFVEEDWTQPSINALVIAVALFLVGPVAAHATARAARSRRG